MSVAELLNESLERRLRKNRLTKSWVAQQMAKRDSGISAWQIYNAGLPGRMEEGRAEGILKQCLAVIDEYEERMGI